MSISKPTDLLELVQYQHDAIVSNTIIKKQTGTITLFAFADGQSLSEHTAPFDALVQILDGQMKIKIGGESHSVHDNESIVLPANVPHALEAAGNTKMLLTMIKGAE